MSPISETDLRALLHGGDEPLLPDGVADRALAEGRRRRMRRRVLSVGVVAAAAAAVVVASAVVSSPPRAQVPAGTVSPSPSVSAARTSHAAAPWQSATTAADVPLPHRGVEGWRVMSAVNAPCMDVEGLAAARGAESHNTVGLVQETEDQRESVVVFPDAAAAVAFMGDLRTAARTCSARTGGSELVAARPLAGAWGEGLAAQRWSPVQIDAQTRAYSGGHLLLAARVGRAVALVTAAGDGQVDTPVVEAARVTGYRPTLDQLAPRLCAFTADGC